MHGFDTTPVFAYSDEPAEAVLVLDAESAQGLGAGLTDFEAYVSSDPNFAGAWNDIQTQLTHEGADASQVNLAKTALVNSFEQLANNLGVSGDDAVNAAHQFVTMGQTVVGAAATVTGLIQTVESGTPPQVVQAFTGVMVSLAITTGTVSAGIGAAIVGGVGLILSALQGLGLFGTSGGTQICGATVNPPPDIIVGCAPIWVSGATDPNGPPVREQPGTIGWRSFPIEGSADDAPWFNQAPGYSPSAGYLGPGTFTWKGLTVDFFQGRAIDYAFPNYARAVTLSQVAIPLPFLPAPPPVLQAGSDFQRAFASAWKSNAEYALNGLKPQADEQVLLHVLRIWNKSHQGPGVPITSGATYVQSLAPNAVQALQSTDAGMTDGTNLLVNSGPLLNPGAAAPAVQGVIAKAAAPPAAAASSSSSAGPVIAVAATAAAGTGLWLYLGRPMTIAAAKAAAKALYRSLFGR